MRGFVIFLILSLSMHLVLSQQIQQLGSQENSNESDDLDSGFKKTTKPVPEDSSSNEQTFNDNENASVYKNPETKNKIKLTRMENFLHNYMNKLERLLRPLKNEHISDRYKKLAEEYFKQLSSDRLDTPEGFQMGDMTIELLDLSNYVLDTVDITEMKKAGVLKSFLLNHVQKNEPSKQDPKKSKIFNEYSDEGNGSWFD